MAARTQLARTETHAPAAAQPAAPGAEPAALELAPDQKKIARKLLIDGATFEDVVVTLSAQGRPVAQHVVENYFRSNPRIYVLRVKRALEVTRKVRKVTQEGDPDKVQLADAIIMTGMMRMSRATAELDMNDALRRRLERENLNYRQMILRLKKLNEIKQRKLLEARTRLLSAKWLKARADLKKTIEELENVEKSEISGPEIAARIREIYGLVQAPPLPPTGEPQES